MKKIICLLFLSLAFLLPFLGHSQSKIEYYPNGKKYFEGDYKVSVSDVEPEDWTGGPNGNYVRYGSDKDMDKSLFKFVNSFPERRYEGACVFYYPNGEKWFSGDFNFGVKQGKFLYWNDSGQLAMERYYQNGMADGHWKKWDRNGKLTASYHYRAISKSRLKEENQIALKETTNTEHSPKDYWKTMDKIRGISDRHINKSVNDKDLNLTIKRRMNKFEEYIEDNLLKRTIWDGEFKVWENGQLAMEFNYANNEPTGIWNLYENGDLAFTVSFQNGEAVDPIEFIIQKTDKGFHQGNAPMESLVKDSSNVTDNKDDIFTTVEDMPQFDGDINRYIQTHINYPEEAMKENIEGTVYVRFVILKTGHVDPSSVKIDRGLGYGINKEAIRVVKSMPRWKPATYKGEAVNCQFIIPISFVLQ